MNYRIAKDWLEASGLVTGIDIKSGVYLAPQTGRRICIVPTGGTMPSGVNNSVTCSIHFISAQNENLSLFEDLINSVIEHSRCNYSFNGYNVKAVTMLPQPIILDGFRGSYEVGFVIQ